MARGAYTIEFYEEDGRSPVEQWMESDLTDVELAALLSALEHVLSHRGVGVCGTEWGKQLGGGLFDARSSWPASDWLASWRNRAPAGSDVDENMHITHTRREGGSMPRTLSDFQKHSKRAKSEPVRRARAVFDQTYTIARQVLELREKHGLTQVELAKASGVPQSQISRIERGAISPTATTLAKIAAVLNADVRLVERRTA